MFLSAFLASVALCSNLEILTGAINLSNLDGWECVAASQVQARGRADAQEWDRINMTNAVFTSTSLSNLSWYDSELLSVYFRDSSFKKVEWKNAQLKDLRFSGSTMNGVTVRTSSGGWWVLEQSTIQSLRSKGSILENVSFIQSAVTQLQVEEGQALRWTTVETPIEKMSFVKTKIDGLSFQKSQLGAFIFSGVTGKGLGFSDVTWKQGEITASQVDGLNWERTGINNLKITGSQLRNWQVTASTGFFEVQLLKTKVLEGMFSNVGMDFVKFADVVFSNTRFDNVKLSNATFERVFFDSSDLSGLTLGPSVQFIDCTYNSTSKLPWSVEQARAMGLRPL